MEKRNTKVYIVFGIIIDFLGCLSILNSLSVARKASRSIEGIEIFFIFLVFDIGTVNILKAFLAKVSISTDTSVFSSVVLPNKIVKKEDIAAIHKHYVNKFVIYKKDGKKVTINYIFENLRDFNNKLKKMNVYITSDKQKALDKIKK